MTTRRAFVGDTARALAAFSLAGRIPGAIRILPAAALRSGGSAATLFAAEQQGIDLHALIGPALEAAIAAGASYADMRIAESSRLLLFYDGYGIHFTSSVSYGIRVVANGASAFIHGSVPELARVVAAARDAVATARGFATLGTAHFDMAPAPVVQGEWTTPIHTDPFAVPLQDQFDVLAGLYDLHNRPLGDGAGFFEAVFDWRKDYRVYGSTDGARTTQTIYRSSPPALVFGARTYLNPYVDLMVPHVVAVAGGYETVLSASFLNRAKVTMETAVELSRLPVRSFDVGRYPVVMEGQVLGPLFGQSVGLALELDRALGYESDAAGTSYLAPPLDILGHQVIHPLLQVTANRTPPHVQAVKWDDDGVEPAEYTLLKDGVVVDYHTSRQTAPALEAWYHTQGRPLRSNGCAVAKAASDPVTVQMPHLTVAPAQGAVSLEDLYKDMAHGLVLQKPDGFWVTMDQQISGGLLASVQIYEVVRGKIVGRVKNAGLQFRTLDLWKSLKALGAAETVDESGFTVRKGIPPVEELCTVTAPAGLFTDVDIVNTGLKV